MKICTVDVDGHRVRVARCRGEGPPLLLLNGIGANLELLEPLMIALGGIEIIAFDVPGVGDSRPRYRPYRLAGMSRLAAHVLDALDIEGPVDVLGISWGGTLAQQFARSHPQRCRRLILAATSPGAIMVPGSPLALMLLLNPRRYRDPEYLARIAPAIYGGEVRRNHALIKEHMERMKRPHGLGYLYQQFALLGWSSLPWLALLRQPTLVLAGSDDPIVPVINARLLARLIPKARLEVFDDGHLFLLTQPERVAPVIRQFLTVPAQGGLSPSIEAVREPRAPGPAKALGLSDKGLLARCAQRVRALVEHYWRRGRRARVACPGGAAQCGVRRSGE